MAKVLGRDYTAASLGANATGTTRTSIATVKDHEGLVKACLAAETRFQNARRVENLVVASEDFTNAGWTKTTTTATADQLTATGANATTLDAYTAIAGDYVFSVELKRVTGTGNIQIAADDGTWTTVTLTTSYQRFSVQQTVAAGSKNCGIRIVTSGDVVNAKNAQLELVEGQTNQNPSEYVSVGVAGGPEDHGQGIGGVDGVQYFPYENGNTVKNNVVTEAQGADIDGISMLLEPAATNEATYSEDQSNAAWVASNITKGSTSQATPAGAASTTVELTASAANGTLLQSFTHASADWSYSVYLKRKTGTGNIDLTLDGGTTWTTKTITSSWARYDISQSAVTNPQFGIRIATSADAIYAWGHFLGEDSDAATSYVANTSTGATTRTTDTDISYPLTTPQSAGMMVAKYVPQTTKDASTSILNFQNATSSTSALFYTTFSSDYFQLNDGTNNTRVLAPTWAIGDQLYVAGRWSGSSMQVGYKRNDNDWVWDSVADTYDGAFPTNNKLFVCSLGYNSRQKDFQLFDVYDDEKTTTWIEDNYPPSAGVTGNLSVQESGADTSAITGDIHVSGTLTVQETGADGAAIAGDVLVSGTLSVQEVGSDTAAISGEAPATITGTLSVQEVGADTGAITGSILVSGSLSVQETGADSATISGTAPAEITGTLAVTETGSDTLSITGTAPAIISGTLDITESGSDTGVILGTVQVAGALTALETGADTVSISYQEPAILLRRRPKSQEHIPSGRKQKYSSRPTQG